ncbi:uncharacterized protein LOC111332477 isoform X2 [Stylophora pistillata]|uniref:uncharacterized protein LOC111332477 isoform X2 n=1 Tax=Stylophora pistillata TaxID=50429 RepID=UPI000C04C20A|nr:uncharacterized protein LOC111332477 isoform X2 [Stylophora pistillata]XP_022793560.1 uncharacterized protein LOC111332477 isoform X2 [Stylophora pistillata]
MSEDLGTNDIEALWLEVYPHKSKPPLLISGVYRPTSAKREYNINLGKNIENAYLANMELIVKEELNYDFLNSTCFYKQNRVKYLNLNQMVNIVAIPASTACLDHIQVSHPERMCIVSVINVGLSDYLPVFASRRYNQWQEQGPCREKKHLSFEYRNLKKIDKDNFIKDLNEAPWDAAFVFEETDEIIDTWYDIFNGTRHNKTNHEPKCQPKWFTGDLNDEIKKRDRLLGKARNSSNSGDWMLFRESKNRVTRLIRNAKKPFFKSQVVENRKKFWSLIRDLSRDSQERDYYVRELDEDGEIVTEDNRSAELFNSLFVNQATKILGSADSCLLTEISSSFF